MRQPTADHLLALLADYEPPCISLLQPTHRYFPDNQQDPIRYRNLLRDVEISLRQKYPTREIRSLLEPFQPLARDHHFWNHRTDGLAIFSSPETFQVFELQRPVEELLIVAGRFHTKPLLRILQSADRYQVLAVNRHEVKLYEGNRYVLDPIELTEVPSTLTQALGEELTEHHLTVASYGAGPARAAGSGAPPSVHGHGGKKDEVDLDRDRFFRTIDRAILEHHSRPSGLPLLLATLTEYHTPFRAVSHNPFLLDQGIQINPDAVDLEQLRALAWEKIEPIYLARLARLKENYQAARSRQMASDDLPQVAQAAAAGRVGTLLVEADRVFPGRFDPQTGQLEQGDLIDPDIGDLVDHLAQTVLRMKGEVVVVPAERMPSATGVAATYRF